LTEMCPMMAVRKQPDPNPVWFSPNKPSFLTPDGKSCFGAEEPYHFECFEQFRNFGDFMNSWRGSTPFRLRELPDTQITYRVDELDLGPNYGHRYEIYYNQSMVGLLQIHASRLAVADHGLQPSEDLQALHQVSVSISLNAFSPIPVPFDDVRDYLLCIIRMTTHSQIKCFYTEPQYHGMTQRTYALYALNQAMMRTMWDNRVIKDSNGSPLSLWFSGMPIEWHEQGK
jgi:hypothetical protein